MRFDICLEFTLNVSMYSPGLRVERFTLRVGCKGSAPCHTSTPSALWILTSTGFVSGTLSCTWMFTWLEFSDFFRAGGSIVLSWSFCLLFPSREKVGGFRGKAPISILFVSQGLNRPAAALAPKHRSQTLTGGLGNGLGAGFKSWRTSFLG